MDRTKPFPRCKDAPPDSPLERAAHQLGNLTRLAETLGVSVQAVQQWRDKRNVPGKWHLLIEELTDGAVDAREFLLWNEGVDDTRQAVARHYRRMANAAALGREGVEAGS